MSPSLIRLIFLATLFALPPTGEVSAHDTPDDFVERAVAVVVKGRQIEVSVQIGINAKTMRDQLNLWKVTEEYPDDIELTQKFCAEIQTRLLEKFELRLGDEVVELTAASVEPYAEHHKTAVMKLHAEIPASVDQCQLSLTDSSFTELDGAVRYAIKGRGKTLVTQSNAAPIIIRATRVELGALDEEQRKAASQIIAQIQIVGEG